MRKGTQKTQKNVKSKASENTKDTKKTMKITYRKLQDIFDVIEEYDLELEQRLISEKAKDLQGLEKEQKELKMLEVLNDVKKQITRERQLRRVIGYYKVYCIIFDIEYTEEGLDNANVGEVEQTFFRFQNGTREFTL